MAKEIGAYEKRGLQADLVFIASGAVTVASLISGDLDMAVAASNAVIAAVSKGAPLVAVGSVTNRPGQTLWVISRRRILDESGRMANSVGGAGARIDALA
jgi:ABC-type nitrate/sulfonate/bicarbonate transport system substrate-binding protein